MIAATIFWILIGIYAALVIGAVAIVLSQNRNPLKSLSWVTVLILLPVFGLLLYFFFGQSIKNTRMLSRRNKRRLMETDKANDADALPDWFNPAHRRMVQLVNSLDNSHFYPVAQDAYKLYNNGKDFFTDLFQDIENAREYVNIQFYIVQDDQIGSAFSQLLKKKAREGVKIRLIYDYVGSYGVKKKFFKDLNKAGVEAHAFFRAIFPALANRLNWRNHRKAVIIDGHTAYIGSTNVADRYLTGGCYKLWRDAGMRVSGAPVAGIQRNFAIDWNFMGQPLILDHNVIENDRSVVPEVSEGMQLLTSGPTGKWGNMALMFFQAISSAHKRIYLQTPYFMPTETLLQALQTAALSGVDVRVMLPRHSDSSTLTYASYSYLEECMMAGIKIYLMEDAMLHSKVLIIDNDFVTFGSANFDFRSFEHNFEENVVAYSPKLNNLLCSQFFEDLKLCTRLRIASWRRRPKTQKAKESILRLLSPLL